MIRDDIKNGWCRNEIIISLISRGFRLPEGIKYDEDTTCFARSRINKVKEFLRNDEKDMRIDFNKIIPVPKKLEETEISDKGFIGLALIYLDITSIDDKEILEEYIPTEYIETAKEYKAKAENNEPIKYSLQNCYNLGSQYFHNILDFGYPDRLSWKYNHWGDCENARWTDIKTAEDWKSITVTFYTHVDPPNTIIRKLSEILCTDITMYSWNNNSDENATVVNYTCGELISKKIELRER